MESKSFCYWLQGYFEINQQDTQSLSATQVDVIKRHLALVFKHEIDPSMGDEKHQHELNNIHSPVGILPDSKYNQPDKSKVIRC